MKHTARTYNIIVIVAASLFVVFIATFILFLVAANAIEYDMQAIDFLSFVIILQGVGIFVLLILIVVMVVRTVVRFTTLISCKLDPDAAMCLFEESKKMIGRRKTSDPIFLRHIHDLKGEYPEALKDYLAKKPANTVPGSRLDLAYYYLRCGMLDDARAIVQPLEPDVVKKQGLRSARLHTLGLYYLELGYLEKAKQLLLVSSYLEEASLGGRVKIARLNCSYDLACLYEKEGNKDQAIAQYRNAAALGPKTWLGQESARRCNG